LERPLTDAFFASGHCTHTHAHTQREREREREESDDAITIATLLHFRVYYSKNFIKQDLDYSKTLTAGPPPLPLFIECCALFDRNL
jgi:hypothetical protein